MFQPKFRPLCCLLLIVAGPGTAAGAEIPAQTDWVDRGTILGHGADGQWDRYLFGMMTPCALVQKSGTYFLYYIGGDSESGAGGDARNRKLGVATSTDRITWTKSPANPIWDWRPTGDWEEGISSCAAIPDGNEIVLYYNALTNFAPGRVNSDIRMITSTDGINFANDVEIVAHDSGCSGCGDEVWPDSVFRSGNNWYLYYSGNLWNIYLATLSSRTTVTQTVKALDLTNKIITALAVPTTPTEVAVFLPYQTSGAPWTTRIRTASLADPATMSGEVGRYDINSVGSHQLYYLDESSNQWLMFYQTSPQNVSVTNIGMMTVDVSVQADTTPPAAPTDLQAQ